MNNDPQCRRAGINLKQGERKSLPQIIGNQYKDPTSIIKISIRMEQIVKDQLPKQTYSMKISCRKRLLCSKSPQLSMQLKELHE